MIECLVFDFDGVLVDSNEIKRAAFFRIFAGFGESGRQWVTSALERDDEGDRFDIIRSVLDQAVGSGTLETTATVEELVQSYAVEYNTICEAHAATCAEITGVTSMLNAVYRRYPLYIVSATPVEPLRRIVEMRGWGHYFKEVLGRPESKTRHLAHVLEREGIGAERLLFVGDGKRDWSAARIAGTWFVGVRNAFNDFDTAGVKMIDHLGELPVAIEQLDAETAIGARGA